MVIVKLVGIVMSVETAVALFEFNGNNLFSSLKTQTFNEINAGC